VDLLFAELPVSGPADLSGSIVVVPGARVGRRLTELLLERCEAEGRPLRPPRISLVGSLPELLYEPRLPRPGAVLERIAWTAALQQVPRRSLEVVFPDLTDDPSGRGALALSTTLRALQLQVGASGRDFAGVAEICRDHLFFNDEERWTILAEIQARYRRVLEDAGFLDGEAARREAVSGGTIDLPGVVWVTGAPDLPLVTKAFLSAAATMGRIELLVAAPEELAAHFDDFGCVIAERWATERAGLDGRAVRVASGPDGQADAVVEKVRELADAVSAEEIVVGVPDPEVVPYLVERFGEVGIATRDASGIPLERTAPYRLLASIAAVLESGEYDDFAGLLRHPDFEDALRAGTFGKDLPESFPMTLDAYREQHLPLRLSKRSGRRDPENRGSATLAASVETMRRATEEFVRPLTVSQPSSVWAMKIGDLALQLFGAESVHRHDAEGRVLGRLAKDLGEVLAELESLPPVLDRRVTGAQAIRFVLDELRGRTVPPEQDEGAIELLGWLELPLDDAPALLLTGANEPHLPESVSADPFLPHAIRKAIGLLDNEGRWARDLFHLRTILATRSEVLIVCGRRDAAGNPLRLSRLLLAEDAGTVARRILGFLEVDRGGVPHDARHSMTPALPAPEPGGSSISEATPPATDRRRSGSDGPAFTLPPERELSAPAPPPSIRVTDFRLILADPYHYALTRVLGLAPMDDRARELDGAGFGGLAHKVLEEFARSPEASSEDPDRVRAALEKLLEREETLRFGRDALPAVRIQVAQLRARLAGFARWQAGWVKDGWRIAGAEVAPAGDGVAFEVDGEPILLRGKVDRIDQNVRTGEWCVLDYKTGEGGDDPDTVHRKGPARAKSWVDLQLPLYRRLVPALRNPEGAPIIPLQSQGKVRFGYIVLARDPVTAGVRIAEWAETEFAEAEEVARAVVRILRRNRFTFERERSGIRIGDPLAALIGGGVLRMDEEEGDVPA